jgi:hypothetical protein
MEYGVTQVDARYREHAERMCVHAGAMLGLSFLPKVKWFLPVTPQNRGQFTEVFSREEGLLGLAKPTEPDVVLVARNQFIEDAMTTLAHEIYHLAQFDHSRRLGMWGVLEYDAEPTADEFAAEAMRTIDWTKHSARALEWLAKGPRKEIRQATNGKNRIASLKASLRRTGRELRTACEKCMNLAKDPKTPMAQVKAAGRRVEEWEERFNLVERMLESAKAS